MKRPVGQNFWFCFMKNYDIEPNDTRPQKDLLLEIYIAGDQDANIKIEIAALGIKERVFVKGGTVKNVRIDDRAEIRSFGIVERDMAVHLTSDVPVSVYALSHRHQTTDSYLVLPKSVLGTSYRAMSYIDKPLPSQFAIVGTEDETLLEITTTANTSNSNDKGKPFRVYIGKGDVYQLSTQTPDNIFDPSNTSDLTGSLISSNKPIAVFSGHQCAYIPPPSPKITGCNHLIEQMPPIPSWGKHFFVGRLEKRSKYTYRVLANFDSTKIFLNSRLIKTLKAGEYYEGISANDIQLTADKPVLVSQYSQGYKNGDFIGDPMMILVSPTQQFLKEYRFATPINGEWNHYINVVALTEAISTMTLNDIPMNPKSFKQLGLSRYSIAYIQVPYGTHYIKGEKPFGMYSYGFGYSSDAYDAYGTMGGQSFITYVPQLDSVPPIAEISFSEGQFKLIFRDDNTEDTGIKYVQLRETSNIKADIDIFAEGVPQYSVPISNIQNGAFGRAVFQVSDVEGNEIVYTLCYTVEPKTGDYSFEINEGDDITCSPFMGYEAGVFFKGSMLNYASDFFLTGKVDALGSYGDVVSSDGIFGFSFTKIINSRLSLSSSLSLDGLSGNFSAPDSISKKIRDTLTNELLTFQEGYEFSLSALFIGLGFSADYFISNHIYLSGGVNFDFAVSNSIDLKRKILTPGGYVYAGGKDYFTIEEEETLEPLNSILFGLYGGLGFKFPVAKKISVFAEAGLNYYPFSIVSDENLNLTKISLRLGAKYRLYF